LAGKHVHTLLQIIDLGFQFGDSFMSSFELGHEEVMMAQNPRLSKEHYVICSSTMSISRVPFYRDFTGLKSTLTPVRMGCKRAKFGAIF